ncbi:MAG: CCDC90 family protein [Magnetococcus sp. THC-1_WYH]
MATITFDTLELVNLLKVSGFPADQADAVVRVIAKSHDELVTKRDLQIEFAPLRADWVLVKWMLGIQMAGVMALVFKSFFPH